MKERKKERLFIFSAAAQLLVYMDNTRLGVDLFEEKKKPSAKKLIQNPILVVL